MLPEQKKLDPRVIRTRRDLAASMSSLMREKPFSQITVRQITEQAMINRATFYAHFEDKYRLLDYIVERSFREKLESKIGAFDGFSPEHLRLLMLATCEFLAEFRDDYAPHKGNEPIPIKGKVQPLVYQVLLRWAKTSGIGGEAGQSAETIVMVTSWTIFGPALRWSHGSREISAENLIEQVMPLLMQGLDSIL